MIFREYVGLAAVCFVSFSLQAQILNPFTTPSAQNKSSTTANNSITSYSKRSRFVQYDANDLISKNQSATAYSTGNKATNKSSIQQSITLNLFDDTVIHAQANQSYVRHDGSVVWLGQIKGDTNSVVNLIASEYQLTGNVRVDGKTFQIRTQKDGSLLINEFKTPSEKQADVITLPTKVSTSRKAKTSTSELAYSTENSELPIYSNSLNGFTDDLNVSVLVYYTYEALEETPDLLNTIDLEFIDTNLAFANSGIDVTVTISAKIGVDSYRSGIGEGHRPFDEMLQRIGAFTNLDNIREKFNADLVHLYPQSVLIGSSPVCGSALLAVYPDGQVVPESIFAQTDANCTGNLFTAHELGHNFGALHDRYEENVSSDFANFGYVDIDNKFRTLMSYPDKCNDIEVSCPKITHFSNPNQTYNNFPTGIDTTPPEATNNAAQINYAAPTIANFNGVTAPKFTSVTQGNSSEMITLQWTSVDNATGYLVNRREANLTTDLEALCSYPIIGEKFEVPNNYFMDITAAKDTTYCYSIVATNNKLLGETYTPESFVKTGYISQNDTYTLPFIEDIVIDSWTHDFAQTLTLPNTFEYQIFVVEHSLDTSPNVQLTLSESVDEYDVELTNIVEANQTLTIALQATHKESNTKVAQLFNVFLNSVENQVPDISVDTQIEIKQQSTNQFAINISDDQPILEEAIYIYSRDEDILSKVWISNEEPEQYNLNVVHEGFQTGKAEIVIKYSDGEYVKEVIITITVKRDIFTPTQIQQNVTWYVTPNNAITRLLPFYDADVGENLTVSMVNEPQRGELTFELSDKVTYTASDDFDDDSFSFYVTGEDGVSTENIVVTIETPQTPILAPTQKLVTGSERAAFLSHLGELYTWGNNTHNQTGLGSDYESLDYIFEPTKVANAEWADVALGHRNSIFALKKDGTLWKAGYAISGGYEIALDFTQQGTDTDWHSINSMRSSPPTFIKTDGSIWSDGTSNISSITNREEFPKEFAAEISQFLQTVPLYNIQSVSNNGRISIAEHTDNTLFSWGENYYPTLLGRSESLGFIAPIELNNDFTNLSVALSYSIILIDQKLFYWGRGLYALKFGIAENLSSPTQISNENWARVAAGTYHMIGIKKDSSLWTWGGTIGSNGERRVNPYLARGEDPDMSMSQVGIDTSWLDTWATFRVSYALDAAGQLWVAGGRSDIRLPTGLPEQQFLAFELTPLSTIPKEVTGTGDVDNDQILDYLDPDDDNDGVLDQYDAFRTDPSETFDSDLDGIGNNADTDDDGDNVADSEDAFPLDSSESVDTDLDGIGNNADTDDDNDGVNDTNDAYPLDSSRSAQTTTPTPAPTKETNGGGGSLSSLLLLMLMLIFTNLLAVAKSKR